MGDFYELETIYSIVTAAPVEVFGHHEAVVRFAVALIVGEDVVLIHTMDLVAVLILVVEDPIEDLVFGVEKAVTILEEVVVDTAVSSGQNYQCVWYCVVHELHQCYIL